jgi:hypothetical protein
MLFVIGRSLMRCFRSGHAVLSLLFAIPALAQNQQMPRDYRGVQIIVPGIFVTPVPNAPFSATIDILSHENLPDGSVNTRTTSAHIARSSSGRIYNERRQLVSTNFNGLPPLLSAHIYDPSSRLSIFYNPYERLARRPSSPSLPQPPPTTYPPALRSTIQISSRKTSAPSPSAALPSPAFASLTPSRRP